MFALAIAEIGIIGALAAIGNTLTPQEEDFTFELLTYRISHSIGTKREVDFESIKSQNPEKLVRPRTVALQNSCSDVGKQKHMDRSRPRDHDFIKQFPQLQPKPQVVELQGQFLLDHWLIVLHLKQQFLMLV